MEQLRKKTQSPLLITRLARPRAVPPSQRRAGRQVTPCPRCCAPRRDLWGVGCGPSPGSKGTHCGAEPQLPLSAPGSPRIPSADWTAMPGVPTLSQGPAPPQRHEPLKHLSNWILRIHLNSKSKIWNNEKADTVAQHGFGLTAA